MADVEISYRGNVIASLSASGTKTLQTSGKYCDDDITVDYTSPGGGGITLPALCATIWGTIASSTYVNVGNGAKELDGVISEYFTYASGVLTCVTAGSYTAYMSARGGYNNQGTARYAHYKLTVNGIDVYVQDSNVAGNGGDTISYPLTLSVGDTVEMKGKTNSGTNTSDYCLILIKTA